MKYIYTRTRRLVQKVILLRHLKSVSQFASDVAMKADNMLTAVTLMFMYDTKWVRRDKKENNGNRISVKSDNHITSATFHFSSTSCYWPACH